MLHRRRLYTAPYGPGFPGAHDALAAYIDKRMPDYMTSPKHSGRLAPLKYYVPLLFSDSELADPWVRIRPANLSSAFRIRFSEHTPQRFFDAREIGAKEQHD